MRTLLLTVLLLTFVVGLLGDCYMQYPPGSNDRNRERNDDRDNGNLLYDSQNNAQGGYPWRGDPTTESTDDALTYYTGSTLTMEWTIQHACGQNPNDHCDFIMQYSLDDGEDSTSTIMPGMRDGYPDSTTIIESDDNNPGYRLLEFSTTTCQGGDCIQQNQDGTNTIPANGFPTNIPQRYAFYYEGTNGGVQFPMHEGIDLYQECESTERNYGLYAADQNIGPRDATGTRQNPNGERHGLECPEERDYYPYWRYTPFRDLAVLTSNLSWCEYYQEYSQNVMPRYYCNCGQATRDANPAITACNLANNPSPGTNLIPITEANCALVGGTWTVDPRTQLSLDKPDCELHPFSRDNHLGNALAVNADGQLEIDSTGQPVPAHHTITIPQSWSGNKVVLRFRYNISTGDYNDHAFSSNGTDRMVFNSSNNCPPGTNGGDDGSDGNGVDSGSYTQTSWSCSNNPLFNPENIPLYNRPYVDVYGTPYPDLSIALNTDQSSRTFQDRSYVFHVANRPSFVDSDANIFNLNTRGRRGNIVQAFPATEYDFHPPILSVAQGDWLHIQFHGSDFNAAKNANNGEGWQFSDRFNLVQTRDSATNFPQPVAQNTLFTDVTTARFFGLVNQDPSNCVTYVAGQNNEQNAVDNCGKLNQATQRFPTDPSQGLVQVNNPVGTYTYVSTRNNNFSNRSQKGTLQVTPGSNSSASDSAAVAAAVVGTVAIASAAFAGVLFYGKKHPQSRAGALYNNVSGCAKRATTGTTGSTTGGITGGITGGTSTTPDMEYQRH